MTLNEIKWRNAGDYGGWARQVADQAHAAFVDLNEIIARRHDAPGEAKVETLSANPHTHASRAGAELNAECAAAGLKALAGDPLGGFFRPRGRLSHRTPASMPVPSQSRNSNDKLRMARFPAPLEATPQKNTWTGARYFARRSRRVGGVRVPPAEPGASFCEPLKAA
ncbi:MAG: hypothetical protein ABSB60_19090 [Terracidiphilus sp.]